MNSPPISSGSRRPLKSRSARWSNILFVVLLKSGATPNGVSLFGMSAALVASALGWAAFQPQFFSFQPFLLIGTAALVQLRLLCNLLDGMLAVEGGQKTADGEFYNEVPDRVSDVGILVGLGSGLSAVHTVVADGLTLGLVAAIGALFTAYIRAMGAGCGAPHYFQGPMAKPHRMAVLTGALLVGGVGLVLPAYSMEAALILIIVGTAVTSIRRAILVRCWLRRTR